MNQSGLWGSEGIYPYCKVYSIIVASLHVSIRDPRKQQLAVLRNLLCVWPQKAPPLSYHAGSIVYGAFV